MDEDRARSGKVLVVYGTRPEAIKMAPLVVRLREHATLEPVVAVTGQHREMLDQVNELFGIEPEHDLDLMVHGAGLADLASRTLAGVQISLLVGFSVAAIALAFGMVLGTLAGFYGGWLDRAIMTVVDIFLAFPSLLLAIGLVSVMGTGIVPVIMAISLADVPRFIRLQRSQVLSLRSRAFIDAARTVDASQYWLMTRHIVPNTIAPMLVAASIAAANAILVEASLSFLGLGIMPPQPSLGNIVRDGQTYLEQAWWISTLPGVVILLIAIGLHFLSDGVRELLDPRSH